MDAAPFTTRWLSQPMVRLIEVFPKGSIWQTRYLCLPLALVATTRCFTLSHLGWGARLAYFLLGALTWSLLEYVLHRFVLHHQPTTAVGRALLVRLHIAHHETPTDETQVCVPFLLSGPSWLGLYLGLLSMGGNPDASGFVICGLALTSVIYDIVHFASHYGRTHNRLMTTLKRNHMYHHHANPRTRFGVTSPLWDHVFRTWE